MNLRLIMSLPKSMKLAPRDHPGGAVRAVRSGQWPRNEWIEQSASQSDENDHGSLSSGRGQRTVQVVFSVRRTPAIRSCGATWAAGREVVGRCDDACCVDSCATPRTQAARSGRSKARSPVRQTGPALVAVAFVGAHNRRGVPAPSSMTGNNVPGDSPFISERAHELRIMEHLTSRQSARRRVCSLCSQLFAPGARRVSRPL